MTAHAADIERVRSADGTQIAYRKVGAGPPVVVLHGALASSLSWLAVAQRLADRFMFLLADRRGAAPAVTVPRRTRSDARSKTRKPCSRLPVAVRR
jgi:pimeloyl-ACP methyl ester carboxylesterase